MADEFAAIMAKVLITDNNFQQDFVALLKLAKFVIQHYDTLLSLMIGK